VFVAPLRVSHLDGGASQAAAAELLHASPSLPVRAASGFCGAGAEWKKSVVRARTEEVGTSR
jgi:hypothetical protein